MGTWIQLFIRKHLIVLLDFVISRRELTNWNLFEISIVLDLLSLLNWLVGGFCLFSDSLLRSRSCLGFLFIFLITLLNSITSSRTRSISSLSLIHYRLVDFFLSLLIDLKVKMRNTIMNHSRLGDLWLILLFIVDKSSIILFLICFFDRYSSNWSLLVLSSRFLLLDL